MLDVLCGIYKSLTFWTKSILFPRPNMVGLWSGMANVCYCCKLNNMLNVFNYVIYV